MSLRECKFCDQCGKQMTVYDSDGEAVHNGLQIIGELKIDYTRRTNCGVSSGRVAELCKADICSYECLTKSLADLMYAVKSQKGLAQ